MTDTLPTTYVEAVEEAATRVIVPISDGHVALVTRDDQTVHEFDLERFAEVPFRKRGTVQLADADSFVVYTTRHSTSEGTTLWADVDRGAIVAVLDDHEFGPAKAGWGQHRATLTLKPTADWAHWAKLDGKLVDQQAFAEHIEDGVDAIRDPDAATMLEIAQTFHARTGASINSSQRLGGQIELAYEQTTTAKAGIKGRLDVPEILTLGLAPFEGNDLYEVKARIRFRLHDGQLSIGYRLIRPDKVRRVAFDDMVAAVTDGVNLPVMAGTPRS